MITIGFFNNKGGVGKTSLVFHIASMLAEMGVRTLAADLDPQANLTSMFLDEMHLEELWAEASSRTVYGAISPLFNRTGDIVPSGLEAVADNLFLLAGDLQLSAVEDELGRSWGLCLEPREQGAFRVIGVFHRLLRTAGERVAANVALIDLGPNLGALNRAALLACEHIVVPVGADLFSVQALRNMGPVLREWRQGWHVRKQNAEKAGLSNADLPGGAMQPAGYVVMRHSVRLSRPVRAYAKWIARMPAEYRRYVLDDPVADPPPPERDPHCLAILRDYRSLIPLAQEARKPMFKLKPADGAFGGHQQLVTECYKDFRDLAERILERCVASPQIS